MAANERKKPRQPVSPDGRAQYRRFLDIAKEEGRTAEASRLIRLAILTLPIFPLAGCFEDQKKQLGRCVVDGLHVYPTDTNAHTVYDRGHLVRNCMEGAGYDFSYRDDLCQAALGDGEDVNPFCYRPMGAIGRVVLSAEIAWMRM
jgi:hypothetical protein